MGLVNRSSPHGDPDVPRDRALVPPDAYHQARIGPRA
jgi:hypothetical protein